MKEYDLEEEYEAETGTSPDYSDNDVYCEPTKQYVEWLENLVRELRKSENKD